MLFFYSCSNPITQYEQNKLLKSNVIEIGINCLDLTNLIGGYRAITYLYLEEKEKSKSLLNSFLLMSTASNNKDKIYYLCERKRDRYLKSIVGERQVSDYDLVKTFSEPNQMIEHILYISSQSNRLYLLSNINLQDYNLSKIEVEKALSKVEKRELEDLNKEIEKAEEELKKKKELEKKN